MINDNGPAPTHKRPIPPPAPPYPNSKIKKENIMSTGNRKHTWKLTENEMTIIRDALIEYYDMHDPHECEDCPEENQFLEDCENLIERFSSALPEEPETTNEESFPVEESCGCGEGNCCSPKYIPEPRLGPKYGEIFDDKTLDADKDDFQNKINDLITEINNGLAQKLTDLNDSIKSKLTQEEIEYIHNYVPHGVKIK